MANTTKVVFQHKNGKFLVTSFNGDGFDLDLVDLDDATTFSDADLLEEVLTGDNLTELVLAESDFDKVPVRIATSVNSKNKK
jgi:hypothetical protein